MKEEKINTDNSPKKTSWKGRAVKGTFLVISAPVRSMVSSGTLAYGSFKKATASVDSVKEFSRSSLDNIRRSGEKGKNDSFGSIFIGEEGEILRNQNIAKFLLKKRAAILLMLIFSIYGIATALIYKQFYGLLSFAGSVAFGVALCFESEFRLWQLRQRRLSVEEKGSFKNFLSEASIHHAFLPETWPLFLKFAASLLRTLSTLFTRTIGIFKGSAK